MIQFILLTNFLIINADMLHQAAVWLTGSPTKYFNLLKQMTFNACQRFLTFEIKKIYSFIQWIICNKNDIIIQF